MKSSSQHTFARVPRVDIPRSSFKRNMTYKTTFDAGNLVPIYIDEVLPGDTFNLNLTSFVRMLSPLKYPILDNLYVDYQFFFCPIRLVWDKYEEFFGSSKGQSGNWEYDDSNLVPAMELNDFDLETLGNEGGLLGDYFGLPTNVMLLKVNALPFRVYNRVIADWYRPSSYELASPALNTGDGPDSWSDYPIQKRLKRCDYFTSALISPQRGPGVDLPIAGMVPVTSWNPMTETFAPIELGTKPFAGLETPDEVQAQTNYLYHNTGTVKLANIAQTTDEPPVAGSSVTNTTYPSGSNPHIDANKILGVNGGLFADLSSVSAVSINSLRQAFQLQRALERDMRGGVRYVEQLLSHFGVRSPDARLQRTEYLGGGTMPIQIHTVANTNGASGSTQAQLAAFAVGANTSVGFVKSFVEHGYIICLASARADLTYQQGVPKMFDRWQRFDFYYPVFAHLGEQIIKNKEIMAQGEDVVDQSGRVIDELPFGYQERYGEYRYGVNKITNRLRSDYGYSLDVWHLAQYFDNLPTLNATFLAENPPMDRIEAVTSEPDFILDALITLNCVRPMPLYGVPGLVDHF